MLRTPTRDREDEERWTSGEGDVGGCADARLHDTFYRVTTAEGGNKKETSQI